MGNGRRIEFRYGETMRYAKQTLSAVFCILLAVSGCKDNSGEHKAKPSAAKGKYVKAIHMASTMGPSVTVSTSIVEK